MNTNDKNEEAKSNIDKIREDLEKKLAALEKAKLSSIDNDADASNEIEEDKTLSNNENISEEKEDLTSKEENKSFLEHLKNIEEGVIEKKENDLENVDAEEDEALFEISDEIENVEEENTPEETILASSVDEVKKEIDSSSKINYNEIENEKKSKIDPVVAPILSGENEAEVTDEVNDTDFAEEEVEEEKKSKLGFLMYGLIGVLILVIGYFVMDYLKKRDKLNQEITNNKINELENRRYQDSIRLLEAEKKLAEFESQRYIDSVAQAERLQLKVVASNNSNKKDSKKEKVYVKPTTTVYKNNKPIATSSKDVSFLEDTSTASTSTSNNPVQSNNGSENNSGVASSGSNNKANTEAVKTKEDEVVAKEIKKEKKLENLNTVEKAPVYPGCERKRKESDRKKCMISKINKFVNSKFNTAIAQDLGLDSGTQKIYVSFIIDRNGYVNVTRVRAKHDALKKEALKVVSKLPKMRPPMKNGKRVDMSYNLPIMFNIEN